MLLAAPDSAVRAACRFCANGRVASASSPRAAGRTRWSKSGRRAWFLSSWPPIFPLGCYPKGLCAALPVVRRTTLFGRLPPPTLRLGSAGPVQLRRHLRDRLHSADTWFRAFSGIIRRLARVRDAEGRVSASNCSCHRCETCLPRSDDALSSRPGLLPTRWSVCRHHRVSERNLTRCLTPATDVAVFTSRWRCVSAPGACSVTPRDRSSFSVMAASHPCARCAQRPPVLVVGKHPLQLHCCHARHRHTLSQSPDPRRDSSSIAPFATDCPLR